MVKQSRACRRTTTGGHRLRRWEDDVSERLEPNRVADAGDDWQLPVGPQQVSCSRHDWQISKSFPSALLTGAVLPSHIVPRSELLVAELNAPKSSYPRPTSASGQRESPCPIQCQVRIKRLVAGKHDPWIPLYYSGDIRTLLKHLISVASSFLRLASAGNHAIAHISSVKI